MKQRVTKRRLLLVRHGEAVANQHGLFLGRRDDALTERGRAQAAALAAKLTDQPIAAVFTSPLQRAADTAGLVFGDTDVQTDARLMEQDYGLWDGLSMAAIQTKFADDYQRWQTGDPTIAPSGGETLTEVATRTRAFFEEQLAVYDQGETLALVGHAGSFQALLCVLLGTPLRNLWPYRFQNATLSEVVFVDDFPVLTLFNAS